MPHFLYILHSKTANRFYIGESVDANIRTQQHNDHLFPGSATAIATDWSIQLVVACDDRAHARALERWIKSQKSIAVIKRLIQEDQYREYQLQRFRNQRMT
ncbi:MAG: GIY-YIG nuclease family protein [Flavobacteriales bacterium]|jgi:putative endonuclease